MGVYHTYYANSRSLPACVRALQTVTLIKYAICDNLDCEMAGKPVESGTPNLNKPRTSYSEPTKESETLDLFSEIMIPVTNVRLSWESAREAVDCLRKGTHDFNNRSGRN
jgi:hypothetical protein